MSGIEDDLRRGFELLSQACTYEPDPSHALMTEALNSADATGAARERARWVEWLADVGYGIDFTHHPHPPCSPREVAEVYAEREPIPACDLVADETSAEVHEWVIAQNTGWEEGR